MKKTSWLVPLPLAILFVLPACTVRVGDFTVASTKNISILQEKGPLVRGEDCADYLFGLIPLGNTQPNIKTAIDDALQGSKANVLIDGVISSEFFFIPYIWLHSCYQVEGYSGMGSFGAVKQTLRTGGTIQ